MKKLFFYNGKPEIIDVPTPNLEQETILVQTAYSFVSRGTELKTLQKNKYSLFKKTVANFSTILKKLSGSIEGTGVNATLLQVKSQILKKLEVGYSISGTVLESNSKLFRKGDLVACAGFGFSSHAEYCVVPVNLAAKVKNKEMLKLSSATAVGAIALQALRRANLQLGEIVCVIGVGLVGLMITQLSKLSGLSVFCVDINLAQLQKAKELGADHIICSEGQDWISIILLLTKNLGVDSVILAAGSEDEFLLENAIKICRKKGKIVVVGDIPFKFTRENFYKKELDLLISCSYGPGRYEDEFELQGMTYPYAFVRWTETRNLQLIANLISEKKLDIEPLVIDTCDFSEANKAYELLKESNLSIIFSYSSNLDHHQQYEVTQIIPAKLTTFIESRDFLNKKFLKTSLVGAGGFSKIMLVPILSKLNFITLKSVFDILPTSALNFKETFGFEKMAQSYTEILQDSDVDVVIVSSPAKNHCGQSIQALSFKKAVFSEKPMITTMDELVSLQQYLTANPDAFYAVDFNRSFAPMISIIMEYSANRYSPFLINYRVNAGLLCMHSNSQTYYSRIVGELCHFFELFLFLIKSNPVQMTVACSGSGLEMFEENMSISLVFEDGSIANLFYSSVASIELGKERGEFFWDKKSIVLDDFKTLTGYGFGKNIDQYSLVQDKGHAAVLSQFLCSVKNNDNKKFSILWDRYFLVSWLTLKTEELLLRNGGTLDLTINPYKETMYEKNF